MAAFPIICDNMTLPTKNNVVSLSTYCHLLYMCFIADLAFSYKLVHNVVYFAVCINVENCQEILHYFTCLLWQFTFFAIIPKGIDAVF